jgi:ATP-dependent 26S proteasome regulatory subunit
MSGDREELERALLTRPFDAELRTRYARTLAQAGEFEASLEQWRLLTAQAADRAALRLELAQCLIELRRPEEAKKELLSARGCADFQAVWEGFPAPGKAALAALETEHAASGVESTGPARLRVLTGGANRSGDLAEVVSISRSGTVRFSDIAGMEELKKLVRLRIVEPFLRPGLFERFKRRSGGGVLLYGPPGCGKTLLARAIATECKASFTAVGISDLLEMWVGATERNLAALFEKARSERPAVLFFDELDALAYSRSKANSDHTRTTVNEFLSQLDGMSGSNDGLLVVGATNMPWDVDEAMKRPGRFDRQVFVPPPDLQARVEMFRLKLRDVPTGNVDAEELARNTEHFSGADIDGVIELAKDVVLTSLLEGGPERGIQHADLLAAIEQAVPSTLDWMKTARNLVKFGGAGKAYKDVESYLRSTKLY